MPDLTQPLLSVYVVWHPKSSLGAKLAEALYEHFRRRFTDIATSSGTEILYRSDTPSTAFGPAPIPFDSALTTAVVILTDSHLATDARFSTYVDELSTRADALSLQVTIVPVALDPGILDLVQWDHQAVRWDKWSGPESARSQRLLGSLTDTFCRMLRHYLAQLEGSSPPDQQLSAYMQKLSVFISHTKRDKQGEELSCSIRNRIHGCTSLGSFLDVYDLPAGIRFHTALLQKIRDSALLALHTDSYSSREWCRREVLEAKRHDVPFVVADCLTDIDEHAFPYLGNVPVLRLDSADPARIDRVIYRLLDEVLKGYLWRLLVSLTPSSDASLVKFLSRSPELLSLADPISAKPGSKIVYPDPPLSVEELDLFAAVAPGVQLRTRTQWLAEGAL